MIERYSYRERLCHWMGALFFVYCLLTGLAFYSPYLFWIATVLGGGPTSRYWHPFVGLAFILVQVWMDALWKRDMMITGNDKIWLKHTEEYATNRDGAVPPQGRFNAGQKIFYWGIVGAAILLLISGLVMWFPERIPFSLAWVRELAVFIHEGAALIAIGLFIIHVYMSVFLVPGSTTAMVRGYVPAAWARIHHRLWYERVR